MRLTVISILIIALTAAVVSCNSNQTKNNTNGFVQAGAGNIPLQRSQVQAAPVKVYDETTKSFATTDEFKVSLFETKETFKYLIKISYKNLNEEDTLYVPDFGINPQVAIVKGAQRPSCIVGFLDAGKQFKESKLIYFEDETLKIHVLKHYAVYAK